jgi:uncharacterized membrane protein YeiH
VNTFVVDTFITFLDYLGISVFAVTGALVASRKQMDIVGFAMLASATGIGGGTLRDLLLGLPVFWVQKPAYVAICLIVAAIVFFTAHIPQSRYRLLLWLDALGLAFFCVVGTEISLLAGKPPFIAIIMGVMTATFGGLIRDILGGEIPIILRKEIYATAALLGASVFTGLWAFGLPGKLATLCGFLACFSLRALALQWGWSLPAYRARPGRSPDELGL